MPTCVMFGTSLDDVIRFLGSSLSPVYDHILCKYVFGCRPIEVIAWLTCLMFLEDTYTHIEDYFSCNMWWCAYTIISFAECIMQN